MPEGATALVVLAATSQQALPWHPLLPCSRPQLAEHLQELEQLPEQAPPEQVLPRERAPPEQVLPQARARLALVQQASARQAASPPAPAARTNEKRGWR
jgi:hypothetical protein